MQEPTTEQLQSVLRIIVLRKGSSAFLWSTGDREPQPLNGLRPGAGAVLLSNIGEGPYVTEILVGRSIDKGITDVNNMGAAMAPAAVDTLIRYFRSSGKNPEDFDLIVTGDLGATGHDIARK